MCTEYKCVIHCRALKFCHFATSEMRDVSTIHRNELPSQLPLGTGHQPLLPLIANYGPWPLSALLLYSCCKPMRIW